MYFSNSMPLLAQDLLHQPDQTGVSPEIARRHGDLDRPDKKCSGDTTMLTGVRTALYTRISQDTAGRARV